jgi:chemotaxis protein MotA
LRRLDVMTVLGLIAGVMMIISALVLGGSCRYFWSFPSLLVTVGGSLAATLINFTWRDVRNALTTVRLAFVTELWDPYQLVGLFGELSRRARREGLLVLEEETERLEDSFFAKGIQLMADAMEPQAIRDILQTDLDYMVHRHELGQSFFSTWGNLAPSFGLIGTLIGLLQMLATLENPDTLGPSMALALVTTFYGAVLAYLILLPLAGKLRLRSEQEQLLHHMMLEGILAIQAGLNPRIVEERMRAFLSPKVLAAMPEEEAVAEAGGR